LNVGRTLDKCKKPEPEEYVSLLLNVLAIHHAFNYLKKNDEEKREAHFPIFLFLQVLLKIPVEAFLPISIQLFLCIGNINYLTCVWSRPIHSYWTINWCKSRVLLINLSE